MSKRQCKVCKYWSKFWGCDVFRLLQMVHLGRQRFSGVEPFPKIKIPKGVCKDVAKAWKLEERR